MGELVWCEGCAFLNECDYRTGANTAAQIVLAAVVLGGEALGMPQPMILTVLVWVIAATTALSGASYIVQASRKVPDMDGRR